MSKKSAFYNYYSRSKDSSGLFKAESLLEKLAKANADALYSFKGENLGPAAIVRADLNGYSTWAKEKPITDRVKLLDHFFTHLSSKLESNKGIYFRDEGDCMVVVFSNYFYPEVKSGNIVSFCMDAVSQKYGTAQLEAKCTVSLGDIAIFQKSHEVGSDDWSAEGEPFVRASRLESAVESKQRIYFFNSDYKEFFDSGVKKPSIPGSSISWLINHGSLQISGLGLAGGWEDITYLDYKPGSTL